MKAASPPGSCLRALFRPLFTRTIMTALVVVPALWAGAGEQIISVALPDAVNDVPEEEGISVVHGALSGVMPQDEGPREWLVHRRAGYRGSPFDGEFGALAAKRNSGGGGFSLGEAFRDYFMRLGSSSQSESVADFSPSDRRASGDSEGPLGGFSAGLLADARSDAPTRVPAASFGSALVPIGANEERFGNGVPAWTTPVFSPPAEMAPNVPGPQSWTGSAPAWTPSGGSYAASNGNSSSGSTVDAGPSEPPPLNAFAAPVLPSSSVSAVTTSAPAPSATSSIVLALAPVSFKTSTIGSGTSGGAVAATVPASSGSKATSNASVNIGYVFVPVGNPGNAPDANGMGSVPYLYSVGQYDVTLTQYCAFLNAVAQTDPYGLYNAGLASDATVAGITQGGTSGSYTYAVTGGGTTPDGNRPVTYVSWFDAARLANWMQNGQPTGLGEVAGSTETGAYTLNNATSGNAIPRNANAVYVIPTANEWYKAAYYDPTLNSNTGGYWAYATRSNAAPGNIVGSGTNEANYDTSVFSVSQSGNIPSSNALTDVGAFKNSASAYGTFDQDGDVFEWTDTAGTGGNLGSNQVWGGSWDSGSTFLIATGSAHPFYPSDLEDSLVGIRLVMLPEPTVPVSLIFGAALLFARRRRRSAV